MAARIDFSVTLGEDDDSLTVKYDRAAAPGSTSVVDVISGESWLLSCALVDVEEFATLLLEFVDRHREDAQPESGDEQ